MTYARKRRLGVTRLWQQGYTGNGIAVGVIATGIDLTHPDLQDQILATKDFTGTGIEDRIGHDTPTSGIIAGRGHKNRRHRGVAYDSKLIVAKVTSEDGSAEEDTLIDALEWLADQGVQVINISIASDCVTDGRDPVSREVNYLVQKRNIIVVCAAGNYGPAWYTIGSPGAAEHAITVGCCGNNDVLKLASSRGPTLDGREKPDFLAPGDRIIAPRANQSYAFDGKVNEWYGFFSLTSFAAPHVAGIAALLRQAFPTTTADVVKGTLRGSCDPAYLPIVSRIAWHHAGLWYRFRAWLKRLFSREKMDPKHAIGCGRVNAWKAYLRLKELMKVEEEKVLASKP